MELSHPKKSSFWIIFLMASNIIFLTADNNIITAVFSNIEKEFNIDSGKIGLISFFFSVIGASVSILWGYISDKVSRKKLFALSILIAEVPCLLTAYAPNFTVFYILRILTGIGVGAAFPLVFSMIGDYFNKNQRTMAAAILTTCWGTGGVVGILVAGFMLGAGYSWRIPFIIVAIPNFILIPLFYFIVPEPQKGIEEDGIGELVEQGIEYPKTIKLSDYVNLIKIKTNLLLFIQGIFGTIPWGALILFVKYLQFEKGFSVTQATTTYAVLGIGGMVGGLLGGFFGGKAFKIDPVYQPLLSAVSTFIGAVIILVTLFVIPPNFIYMCIGGFIGTSFATITAANMRNMLLSTNPPEDRGAIFSFFNLTDAVGYGLGQFFAGQLAVYIGIEKSLGISFSFWFPCTIFLYIASFYFPDDVKILNLKMIKLAKKLSK